MNFAKCQNNLDGNNLKALLLLVSFILLFAFDSLEIPLSSFNEELIDIHVTLSRSMVKLDDNIM